RFRLRWNAKRRSRKGGTDYESWRIIRCEAAGSSAAGGGGGHGRPLLHGLQAAARSEWGGPDQAAGPTARERGTRSLPAETGRHRASARQLEAATGNRAAHRAR